MKKDRLEIAIQFDEMCRAISRKEFQKNKALRTLLIEMAKTITYLKRPKLAEFVRAS